jgi:hypothetical protein
MIWWRVFSDWLMQLWNDWVRDGGQVRSEEDELRNAVLRKLIDKDDAEDDDKDTEDTLYRAKDLFTDDWFTRRAEQGEQRNPNNFRDQ